MRSKLITDQSATNPKCHVGTNIIIDVGSYGKESDCNIFKQSRFEKKLYADKVNFPPDAPLPGDEDGVPQPFIVVGDEAFVINKHLLRPFPGKSLINKRRIFNYRLSRARRYIECTFGILSNKWESIPYTNFDF
ncbi:hypothetical protein QTP88_020060 [Uroleucon formosanum]